MRTWPLVFIGIGIGLGACGPIYPDQQPARQPAADPTPAPTSGPPGGGADPWAGADPAVAPSGANAVPGRPGQPGDPYGAQGPSDPYATPEPASRPGPERPRPAPQPQPAPAPQRPSGLPADWQALLDAHNRVRARHCAPALQWSPKLAQFAQQWASSLRDQGCKFGHSGGSHGENLAAGTSGSLDGQEVTNMWYDEIKQYSFPNGGFSMETGHFTQVVWRESTHLGCAKTTCRGMDIWVCEYDPPGNVQGMYRQNVLPVGCR